MFEIPGLSGKAKTYGTVGSTIGKVIEDVVGDGMVSEDSDPDSGYSREEHNANEDADDGDDDNFQVPND